ncbi:MAG: hypothetical protein Q8Q06_02445 [bacterium]|nr:hypothetical protein [bacterium]
MKKSSFLAGSLAELFEYYKSSYDVGSEIDIRESLSGRRKNINPKFRIPSVDKGTEIFFDDEELFVRFANMTLPNQNLFCETIRGALKKADASSMHLEISWSENETKILEIRMVNQHHLDIFFKQ